MINKIVLFLNNQRFSTLLNEEIIEFVKENPHIKPIKIKIDDTLKRDVNNWARFHLMSKPDVDKINNISKIDFNNLPPIILHQYGTKTKIIDGWHRLYVAIQKNIPSILAYKKIYSNNIST